VSDAAGHTINLGPGAFKIFTDVALPKPFNRLNITVIDSLSGVPVNGAQIQIEESGTQYADEQGKAWFTSSLNKVSVDVTAPGFEVYTRTFNSNNTLDFNILLKRGSGFGLGDEAEKLAVNVSPNPANEKLTIVAEQNYLIKCYGLDGRLLLTHQMQNRTEKLDISNLAKGFYVLQFTHDGKMIALKVAKQ
jgi:hypothetical protein